MFGAERRTDAGRSTKDYYEIRLRAWHRHNRTRFAVAIGIAASLAIPTWIYLPLGEFYAGMIVGALFGMIVWVRDYPPEMIAKWKRGADGERETGSALRRLEKDGWFAVHDRAAGRGNLDHIAVSPAGVFVLESKSLSGTISIRGDQLVASYGPAEIDSYTNQHLAGVMRRRGAELKERIQNVTGVRCFVHAVVVIWGEFPATRVDGDRVTFVSGEALARWLASLEHSLAPRDVSLIRLALTADVIAGPAPPLGTVVA